MSWAGLAGAGVSVSDSPLEQRRFGVTVGRVVVGNDTPPATTAAALAEALHGASHDVLVVRWPSERVALAATVASSGRIVLPADVLTYWEVAAEDLARVALRDGGALRVDRGSDRAADGIESLVSVVESSFAAYGNHYTANPAFDPELALAGYVEWARTAFERHPDDACFLIDGATPIGVATLSEDRERGDLEVELAGLVPGSQGRGLYGHLLRAVGDEALRRGLGRVIISTQAHNVRVQRAWAGLGLRPFAAVTTAHAVRPGSSAAQMLSAQRS